jgi:hypothetical protein
LNLKRRPKQGYAYEVNSSLKDSTQLRGKKQRGCSLLPRTDIITPDCIMKVLHTSKPEAHKVIREAMRWGVLTLAVRKNNKPWYGHYQINWSAVEWVASLIPMNIGIDFDTMTPKRQVKDQNRYLFGAHRLAVEAIKEFYGFWRTTRVQAFSQTLHAWPAGNMFEVGQSDPPFIPPEGSVLHYALLELNGRLVYSLVLGYGNVYFIPVGVRGGAQSCFPCVAYGSGKYLCAGSLQSLLKLLGLPSLSSLLSLPEPYPYGGHSPRLVVDTGKGGLVPYESFTPGSGKYEPGVQTFGSALQHACLSRWYVLITSRYKSPFHGWPSLVLEQRAGTGRAVSYRPDAIRREVLQCIDALQGFRHSLVRGLKGTGLSPQSSAPYALALASSVAVQAVDPQPSIYVEVIDGFKVKDSKNRYRHEDIRKLYTLEEFAGILSSRDRPIVAKTIRVIVPLAETPYLKEVLSYGFFFIYHNPDKDPEGAVRAEYRAYKGVTEAYGKEGTMRLALGTLHMLGQALSSTYQALTGPAHLV